MKAYYAHPVNLYNTLQEKRDIEIIEKLGYEVVNPNQPQIQEEYNKLGMVIFESIISECDIFIFRCFPDLKIGSGIYKEIEYAYLNEIPVLELPTILDTRILSVDDTRKYLKYLGIR